MHDLAAILVSTHVVVSLLDFVHFDFEIVYINWIIFIKCLVLSNFCSVLWLAWRLTQILACVLREQE